MSDPTPPMSATPSAPKKRSPVERAIVWGVIVVLLAVLGWEWNARNGYQQSIADLEETIEKSRESPLMAPQLDDHIHGYVVRNDGQHSGHKFVKLQWPSLFKDYKLAVMIDDVGQVRSVETELPEYDSLPDVGAGGLRPAATEQNQDAVVSQAVADHEQPAKPGEAAPAQPETAAEPAKE